MTIQSAVFWGFVESAAYVTGRLLAYGLLVVSLVFLIGSAVFLLVSKI